MSERVRRLLSLRRPVSPATAEVYDRLWSALRTEAIDAGRRLVQLNIMPSFAQLEGWINAMEGGDEPESTSRRGGGRAKAA